jgi:murein L,D-transpeptidase YcbB/YkuD
MQMPMLRICPDSENSVIQFYDTTGAEQWHIGKEAKFSSATSSSATVTTRIYAKLTEAEAMTATNYYDTSKAVTLYYSSSTQLLYTTSAATTKVTGTYYDVSALAIAPKQGEAVSGKYMRTKYTISSGKITATTAVEFYP